MDAERANELEQFSWAETNKIAENAALHAECPILLEMLERMEALHCVCLPGADVFCGKVSSLVKQCEQLKAMAAKWEGKYNELVQLCETMLGA